MFNFLFEGKIGDMLAPIQSPEQQLHLSIQHHRNNEAESMINSGAVSIGTISNGYADIHVACRFNNQYVLDLCLSRDSTGNTPLHYAAKNGHIDICKRLVELKANAAARNSQGQTAYDLAQNHIIRQYLLPLQLAIERDMPEMQVQTDPFQFRNGMLVGAGGGGGQLPMNSGYPQPPPAGIPIYAPPGSPHIAYQQHTPPSPHSSTTSSAPGSGGGGGGGGGGGEQVIISTPISSSGLTAMGPPVARPPSLHASLSSDALPQHALLQPPVTQRAQSSGPLSAPGVHLSSMPAPTAATRRVIQADGFGSSASDPVLQAKYGHNKIVPNVAPPPIFGSPAGVSSGAPPAVVSYSMFAPPAGSGASPHASLPYNRYVPYDINNPNPAPLYAAPAAVPAYGGPPIPYGAPPPHSPYGQQIPPSVYSPANLASPPASSGSVSSAYAPPALPNVVPPRPASTPASIETAPPPALVTTNADEMADIDLDGAEATPHFQALDSLVGKNISTFNPATDKVVSATSTSSAIL